MRSLRHQFITALGANGVSQAATVVVQLGVLPILILSWGAERTGAWLILYSLTSWLTLADLGFANVAGNAMTMERAAGNVSSARRISDSAWAIWSIAASALSVLAILGAVFLPVGQIVPVEGPADRPGLALVLLVSSVGLSMAHGCAGAAMRAQGRLSTMVLTTAASRLAEAGALCLVAIASGSFWAAALAMLLARSIVTFTSWFFYFRANAELRPGLRHAGLKEVAELIPLAAGYLAFNLGHAVSIQGTNIVTGIVLGPTFVVLVSAVRTLARAGRMAIAVVVHAAEPLFAQYAGHRDTTAAVRAQSRLLRSTLIAIALYAGATAILAEPLLALWTRGTVTNVPWIIFWFGVAVGFEMMWLALQTPYVSTNRHNQFAWAYLFLGIVTLPMLLLLAPIAGLISVALVTAVTHGGTLIWTLIRIQRHHSEVIPVPKRVLDAV